MRSITGGSPACASNEAAARELHPVYPQRVAEDVIASRLHVAAVIERRRELVAAIADFVRKLRASNAGGDD